MSQSEVKKVNRYNYRNICYQVVDIVGIISILFTFASIYLTVHLEALKLYAYLSGIIQYFINPFTSLKDSILELKRNIYIPCLGVIFGTIGINTKRLYKSVVIGCAALDVVILILWSYIILK